MGPGISACGGEKGGEPPAERSGPFRRLLEPRGAALEPTGPTALTLDAQVDQIQVRDLRITYAKAARWSAFFTLFILLW